MSRFFVSSNFDSSSSEEDFLSSSEDNALIQVNEISDNEFNSESESESESDRSSNSEKVHRGASYYLKKNNADQNSSSSESEEDNKKIVKSAKDKLLDEMRTCIDNINTLFETDLWTKILLDFNKLGRLLVKSFQQKINTPTFYIKFLCDLENKFLKITEDENFEKKLNASEAKSFNIFNQRLKKTIKENETFCNKYKENSEIFECKESVETLFLEKKQDVNIFYSNNTNRVLSDAFSILKSISENRGKKNIDKFGQIQILEKLLETSSELTLFELISVYLMLISIRFDSSVNQTYMSIQMWNKNKNDINLLLDLLNENIDTYQVSELGLRTVDIDIEPLSNDKNIKVIYGSINSLVDRLDDEFTRYLQNTDPHSSDYIERLKDETVIYKLIVRVQYYIESITPKELINKIEQIYRIVLRRLEHIFYKPNKLISIIENEAWKGINYKSEIIPKFSDPAKTVETSYFFLKQSKNQIYGKYALLYLIYYYSVNNQYLKAKKYFLSYPSYKFIHQETQLQFHYNRALVQLGLSAFRNGAIEESYKILNEIVNSQRSKELLGQGFCIKYPYQASNLEKQKLLPFHQHINLELLECVFITCSLLIQIPSLAASTTTSKDSKRKVSLKSFKSKLEFYERMFFTGPPESVKDHIIHASIALYKGDWVESYKLLSSIKIWDLFPNSESLLDVIKFQLQVEGLRTYVFNHKSYYSKFSLIKLKEIFQLEIDVVISVLKKMIENNEVSASIDPTESYLCFDHTNYPKSKLQELSLLMTDKLRLLTEKNEKTSFNGYGKKQTAQQINHKEKDNIQEEVNRFRYANINSNSNDFQTNL